MAVAPASLAANEAMRVTCEYSGEPVGLAESSRPNATVPRLPRKAA